MILSRRQFLLGACTAAAAAAGAGVFANLEMIQRLVRSVPILLYHKVGKDTDSLTVTPERFSCDMQYLADEGYTTLSLEDIRHRLQKDEAPIPSKPVLITFDDGYLDNYTNAFPILEKYNFKASFYIITGLLGHENRINAAQIREMAAAGMDIGSHTVTHRSLGELPANQAMTELTNSKATLEDLLGKSIDFIAYPCGSFHQDTLRLVKDSGYLGGFSVKYGNAVFTDKLVIRRIPIFNYDRAISHIMFKRGLYANLVG